MKKINLLIKKIKIMRHITKISVIILVVVSIFSAGCDKKDETEAPQTPTLSETSLTLEEGESKEVTVSNGVSPYSASISPLGIAGTAINGSRLIITGVKPGNAIATVHGSDGGKASVFITVVEKTVDVYSEFKADATLRIKLTNGTTVYNLPLAGESSPYIFYRDKGNELFSSAKTKIGYARRDASTFFFLEWDGDISLGTKSAPTIRTETGLESLNSIEIVQVKDMMIWIVWNSGLASGQMVQRWE
jgi:hypothetical protein